MSSFTLLARRGEEIEYYSRIQIWRKDSQSNSNTYNAIHTIGGSGQVRRISSSIYEYTPSSGSITVIPGDILGLLVRNTEDALYPYFRYNGATVPGSYYVSGIGFTRISLSSSNSFQYLPQIAVKISEYCTNNIQVYCALA